MLFDSNVSLDMPGKDLINMEENVWLVALLCLCQQHTHVVPNNLPQQLNLICACSYSNIYPVANLYVPILQFIELFFFF